MKVTMTRKALLGAACAMLTLSAGTPSLMAGTTVSPNGVVTPANGIAPSTVAPSGVAPTTVTTRRHRHFPQRRDRAERRNQPERSTRPRTR